MRIAIKVLNVERRNRESRGGKNTWENLRNGFQWWGRGKM